MALTDMTDSVVGGDGFCHDSRSNESKGFTNLPSHFAALAARPRVIRISINGN